MTQIGLLSTEKGYQLKFKRTDFRCMNCMGLRVKSIETDSPMCAEIPCPVCNGSGRNEKAIYIPTFDDLFGWLTELKEKEFPIFAEQYAFKDFFYWWNYKTTGKDPIKEELARYILTLKV